MKIKYLFIFIAFLTIFFNNCAKVSSPTGGPRDSIPPRLIVSEPDNYSTDIDETTINLTFDEFIQLKDVNSTLIVSPPLEEKPIIKLKGKSVSIELNNELKDSTTYTLNFGNSIVDNNEGNPLENFEFVFSTGNSVDSFSIAGRLLNSLTLEPTENRVFISLYKNLADTAPLTQIPYYISRTDKKGYYSINNIASGSYRLFAVEDVNNNLYYDLPNENIAFFDSIISIDASSFHEIDAFIDTTLTDSLIVSDEQIGINNDSVALSDSVYYRKKYAFNAPLFLFNETRPSQYIMDNNRSNKHRMQIILNEPFRDSIQLTVIDPSEKKIGFNASFNNKMDTLNFWLQDTVMANVDSIRTIFSYYATDSIFNYYWKTDTLDFNFRETKKVQERRGRKPEEPVKKENISLKLKPNVSTRNSFDLNKYIVINTTYPIDKIIKDSIKFYSIEDTIKTEEKFELDEQPNDITNFSLKKEWKPLARYEVSIVPGAINNIYNYEYDSLKLSFRTQEKEFYGYLKLNITGFDNPLIIQLMDKEKSKIIDERYCNNDTTLIFDYLHPETYQLKMIHDIDGDKKWTTGDYSKNRQPEKVEFYSKTLNIRSNWEIEENWENKDTTKPDETEKN